ncbi:MAG: hypothetical protein WCT85_06795, partial [Parachlamydiales bacterium]
GTNIGDLLDGGNGNNTLIIPSGTNIWNITSSNHGNINSSQAGIFDFDQIQNLTGGSGADTFNISDGISITGTINGGSAGTNTLNYNYTTPITVTLSSYAATGASGSDGLITAGFSNITSITGESGINTLIGLNSGNTFNITGSNLGDAGDGINSVNFTNFRTITGGNGNDTFNVESGGNLTTINLGLGINQLNMKAGAGTVDTVNGGGTDSYSLVGGTINNLYAGDGDDTFTMAGTNIGDLLDGGNGNNTLIIPSGINTWNITSINHGNIDSSQAGTFDFDQIQNLTGGTGADTFNIADGITLTGSINGGSGGTNTINYQYTTPITVTLSSYTATGVSGTDGITAGFSNITGITGGSGANILIGLDTGNTFNITGSSSGNAGDGTNSINFTDFGTITGGSGDDIFNVESGGSLNTINLGSGVNQLNMKAGAGTVDTVNGGGTDSYDLVGGVITNLYAGDGNDTFTLAGTNIGGMLDGGNGNNTLIIPSGTNTWNITSSNHGNINSSQAGIFDFDQIQNLTGGTGNDIFNISDGISITGTINGGSAGTNTINYNYTSPIVVTLSSYTATGASGTDGPITGGFGNITNINGGSASNTLIGSNSGNTFSITGNNLGDAGVGTNYVGFTSFGTINGGNGNDIFNVEAGGNLTRINLGSGVNQLNMKAGSGTVDTVYGGGTDSYSLVGGVINNLYAGNGNDTFTMAGTNIGGMLDGGNGNNTLIIPDGINTWSITGVNAGNVNSSQAGSFNFDKIQNLASTSGNNNFIIGPAGEISGNLNGGNLGENILDYNSLSYNNPVTINLNSMSAAAIGGAFNNIDEIISDANFSLTNEIIGNDIGGNWNIDGINTGTAPIGENSIKFTNFGKVFGGNGNDVFIFIGSQIESGIDGMGGINTFIGPNVDTLWMITGLNTGTMQPDGEGETPFTNINNLVGGSGNDIFVFGLNGLITGTIDGKEGENTLAGPDLNLTWYITDMNKGYVDGIASFENIQNLTGGILSDVFVLSDQAGTSGILNGGLGEINTLDYSAYTTPVVVDLSNGTATNIGHIENIQNVILNQQIEDIGYFTFLDITYDLKGMYIDNYDYVLENSERFYNKLNRIIKNQIFKNYLIESALK